MFAPQKDIQEQVIVKAREDAAFKQQLLSNPKATLAQELGQEIPEKVEIEIGQQTPSKLYLVLPLEREQLQNQELSEQELETVAGGGIIPSLLPSTLTLTQTQMVCTKTWSCKN